MDRCHLTLWCSDAACPLHAKAFAVLCGLRQHAGQLVTKEALFEAVWPATAVREAVLHVAMREVRQQTVTEEPDGWLLGTDHWQGDAQ